MDMREQSADQLLNAEAEANQTPAAVNEDAAESSQPQLSRTPEQVVEALVELSGKDAAEISREEVSHLKMQFYTLRKRQAQQMPEDGQTEPQADKETVSDPLEEQLKNALAVIKEKKAILAKEIEDRLAENLREKNAIVDEITAASGDTDNVGKLFNRVKELQEQFKQIGEVPQTDATAVWKKYQEAVELFYDRLKINKELRDYDFRKNLEQKELIIDQARKLDEEQDIVVAFRRLQELHDKWREIGPVEKEKRDLVWNTFKEVSANINKRYQAFFEERKAREQQNEAAKTELCERLEAVDIEGITSFKGWEEATARVLAMQQEWKSLGYASRKSNNALYDRFRKLCDGFFAAKAKYYYDVKSSYEENLKRKIELADKAEALAQSDDFRKTTDILLGLQKEWKTIGTVPRKQSDAVWKRFTEALDLFFERKKKAGSTQRNQEQENLAAKKAIIAMLESINEETPRQEGMKILRDSMAQWQKIGHVPFKEKDKVYTRYRELVNKLYESLDMRGNNAAMSRFQENLSQIEGDRKAILRERERMVRAYEARKSDLSTAENNLGFFTSKSRSGDSMIREMERRVQRLKEEIEQLENKIRILDSKL